MFNKIKSVEELKAVLSRMSTYEYNRYLLLIYARHLTACVTLCVIIYILVPSSWNDAFSEHKYEGELDHHKAWLLAQENCLKASSLEQRYCQSLLEAYPDTDTSRQEAIERKLHQQQRLLEKQQELLERIAPPKKSWLEEWGLTP